MNRFKKIASIKTVSLAFSIFTLLAYHFPVFNYAANNVEGGLNGVLIMGGAAIIMLALNYLVCYTLLYAGRWGGKIILSLMLIGNSIALYFINTYEVLITDKMMGNVFNTRYSEASGFFSSAAVLYIIFLGILPCVYILTRKIIYGNLLSIWVYHY